MFTSLRISLTAIIAAGLLALYAQSSLADSPVLDRVLQQGELRVAMSGDQAPFNMRDRDGNMMGLEVDLVSALAASMGVELVIVNKPFAELLPALDQNKVDMVVSGMAITPQRIRSVSFIGPYMLSGKSILTRSDVLAQAQASEDLNKNKLKLAALSGSTSQQFVETNLPEAALVKVADYETGVTMVREGKVDALVADMPVCVLSALRYPEEGLMTLDQPITLEPVGIAVSAADAQFKNLVETTINAFEKTGMLTALRQKWLENGSWIAQLP
jgi:polar amino acid transport system substrate-binding protein